MAVRFVDETTDPDIEVRKTSVGYELYKNGRFVTSKFSQRGAFEEVDRIQRGVSRYDE